MTQLNANWLVEGLIDFEYKKYMLLAYLQEVSKNFSEHKLYPFMMDLVNHYNNLVDLRENKRLVSDKFPKQITQVDLENFHLEFEKLMGDDKCIAEVEAILEYAIPRMNEHLKEGKDLYEFVEGKLNIFPIGIMPLHPDFGYLMLCNPATNDTPVYEYQITIFESAKEKYRGIKTEFVDLYQRSISNTFEHIKSDLIHRNKTLPNPATYVIESDLSFPVQETFLPVAKRSLVRYIQQVG